MSDVLCGSHLPLLAKLMQKVDKPVLELGIGYSSTPFLHWACKERGVNLISIETDEKWYKKFESFRDDTHQVLFCDQGAWDGLFQWLPVGDFGLVFIDHRPARKRRNSALRLKDNADYIVLHDSELADHPAYKYTPIYKHFKYKHEYQGVGTPFTTVLSNREDLSWLNN